MGHNFHFWGSRTKIVSMPTYIICKIDKKRFLAPEFTSFKFCQNKKNRHLICKISDKKSSLDEMTFFNSCFFSPFQKAFLALESSFWDFVKIKKICHLICKISENYYDFFNTWFLTISSLLQIFLIKDLRKPPNWIELQPLFKNI